MKKKVVLACTAVLLIVLALVFLINKGGNTFQVERIIGQSSIYTEEEIKAAMDVAEQKFKEDFEGCKLLRIEYDEGKTLSERVYWSERYGVERAIVLESDFYAGSGAEACFNTDHTYKNWKWILTDEGSGWVLRTSGYG